MDEVRTLLFVDDLGLLNKLVQEPETVFPRSRGSMFAEKGGCVLTGRDAVEQLHQELEGEKFDW